jgi:hypothetical protein
MTIAVHLRRIRVSPSRTIAIIYSQNIVWTGHHVQVDVKRNLLAFRFGEIVNVVSRSDQANLFGSPPSKTNSIFKLVFSKLDS